MGMAELEQNQHGPEFEVRRSRTDQRLSGTLTRVNGDTIGIDEDELELIARSVTGNAAVHQLNHETVVLQFNDGTGQLQQHTVLKSEATALHRKLCDEVGAVWGWTDPTIENIPEDKLRKAYDHLREHFGDVVTMKDVENFIKRCSGGQAQALFMALGASHADTHRGDLVSVRKQGHREAVFEFHDAKHGNRVQLVSIGSARNALNMLAALFDLAIKNEKWRYHEYGDGGYNVHDPENDCMAWFNDEDDAKEFCRIKNGEPITC